MRTCVIAVALLSVACAEHKPISVNWRLVAQDSKATLIPPGPALTQKGVKTGIAAGAGRCPTGIRVSRKRIVATLNPGSLDGKPDGWLTTWAADAEAQGCIASGEAPKLASRVIEALPLDPQTAFHALYPDDLVPPVRLQVVSPILHDDSKPVLTDEQVAGNGNQLTLSFRADNLAGYETALYEVRPGVSGGRVSGDGYTIVPLFADRRIDGKTERRAQPATNYFQFPADAGFIRLFIKSGETAYTALAIAAPTRAEVTRMAAALEAGTMSCEALGPKSCISIPRRVALNAVVPVTINGAEVLVRWGADLAEGLRNSGARQPNEVLASLTISRLYAGKPVTVEFDKSNPAILRLPLTGGEVISWKQ